MRELITIHVGGCGNHIGESFWDMISGEHGIDPSGNFYGNSPLQLQQINVFYNEMDHKYYPRAICADTDRDSVQKVKTRPHGKLFSPDNMVFGREGTGNNFAKGYLTEGAEIMDALLDVIRREAESVDCLQGFLITHAIGGGTGSGMCSLLLKNLSETYPDNLVNTFTVFPSSKVSNIVVEPYNAILAFPQLLANSHQTFYIDNEALHNICLKILSLPAASLRDMNHIIAHTMSGVTTSFRFPGQLNSSLRKLYVNMTPFPNLHFFVPGYAPLTSCHKVPYRALTVPELVMQIFSSKNILADLDFRNGKFLTAAAIFRGLMSTKDVDLLLRNVKDKSNDRFIPWIPNNIKSAICDIPPRGLQLSATFVGNTTAITHSFKKCLKAYQSLFKHKANIHWYTGEGVDIDEFQQAQEEVTDLINEYKKCENLENDVPEEEEFDKWSACND